VIKDREAKMLATQTFSSWTSYKHTKSQQKSTQAKYKENQVLFIHVDAMFLCKLAVLQSFFTTKFLSNSFNIRIFQKSVINRRNTVSAHYWKKEKHLIVF